MNLVAYATPVFIVAMLFELVWGLRSGRNTYRLNDSVSSLFLGTLSQARRFVTLGIGGLIYYWVAENASLKLMSASNPWTWVVAMVLYDFCYYWLHRLGHERSILWAAHVAHHQSEDYNLSTALRQTSTGFLLGWVFYLPMFVLGIPAEVVVTVGSINLLYQFWVHTEHVGKLGWYEWLFVTPSNHRVHHAQNERYLDKNYGGLFIIWDRLFGTFQEELEEEPPIFGIRGALRSWSPAKALTHIYVDMAKDSWATRRWSDKLRVWVSRTGWRPADVQERAPRSKADLSAFERYDPPVSVAVKFYAVFQLVATVVLLVYLQQGVATGYNAGVALTLAMLATMLTTAWWLEGRAVNTCRYFDGVRLAVLGLALYAGSGLVQPLGFPVVATLYLILNMGFLLVLGRGKSARQPEDELKPEPEPEHMPPVAT